MSERYHPIKEGTVMVPLPDTQQKEDYSCGASALMSICRYFGLGPDYEEDFIAILRKKGMDTRTGAHPEQLINAAKGFGLAFEPFDPMTVDQLKSCLRSGRPVLMMIQAWGVDEKTGQPLESYENVWSEGHWVVAIGFDEEGVFFEDPSLEAIRGYVGYGALKERWHDRGPRGRHMRNYGLAIWQPGSPRGGAYQRQARRID